jgi:nitrous oxide reductase accessory protein NosL
LIWRNIYSFILAITLLMANALPVLAHDDLEKHRSCAHCGMDRKAYGYSRMLIVSANGNQTGVCSLHCAVTEMNAHPEQKIAELLVADRNTHDIIAASKAFWVMGGRKRGVMTRNPKWAFASPEAAQRFISDHGGNITPWDEVLAAARKEPAQ